MQLHDTRRTRCWISKLVAVGRMLCHGVLLVTVLAPTSALAQKTDTLTLVNGDQLTGEVKELTRGLLRFSTNSAGTLYIEWQDIASIQSTKHFSIETASGVRAFGSLKSTENGKGIDVQFGDRTVRLNKATMVGIAPVKDNFWKRLDGSIAFGFSYKKANDDVQVHFDAKVSYRTRRNIYSTSLSALVSSQNNVQATERYVGNFTYQGYLRPRWSSLASGELEQNTELDLKLRALVQGGGLYRILNTNRTRFDLATGLALNDESYFTEGKDDRTSLELFGSVGYEFFKFNTPKADVVVRFTVYPSLTESGRFRTNLNSSIRWEIVKDLNWAITVYSSTDNKPPESQDGANTSNSSGTDYGIINSLEWTF